MINILKKLYKNYRYYRIKNVSNLIEYHFKYYSSNDHINKSLLKIALENFKNQPINIFETGSSAWGTNSSILFDNYIRKFGGNFVTVDIREEPSLKLNKLFSSSSIAYVDDSIEFIANLNVEYIEELNLIYLDSYDVDLLKPQPAMQHGLKEFLLLDKHIKPGTIIAVDDTPKNISFYENFEPANESDPIPGKGTLILEEINKDPSYEIMYHHYGVILQKN